MNNDKIYDFLLENAGPSIQYRTKKEIIKHISLEEEQALQEQILLEKDIRYIFENRQPDGWLGTCFHSRMRGAKHLDVCEVALRFLAEKGIKLDHEVFSGAMNAYLTRDKLDPIYDGSGKLDDDYKYPCMGLWLVRSSGIARCGYENSIDISKDINYSLNSFLNVLNYNNIEEAISLSKGGKYYFKENLLWPCNYHLKILAFTNSWRTTENIKQLARAIDHLLSFPVFEHPVYTKIKSFYAAPCDAFIQPPIEKFDPLNVKGMWFEKMELFLRCGVLPYSKYLLSEIFKLGETIDNNGICQSYVDKPFFKNWGAYSGLKLEENWRTEVKKRCDITFRALLILSYAEKDKRIL